MPPRNSPTVFAPFQNLLFVTDKISQETPADATSTSPYLEQLAQLASPVPDFAATLITQTEQDANDNNVEFLRTPMSSFNSGPSEPPGRRRPPYLSAADFDNAERDSQRRMRRAVLQQRRYTPSQLQELDQSLGSSQGTPIAPNQGIVPSSFQYSGVYQGWAPGTSDNDVGEVQSNLSTQMRILLRQQTLLNQNIAARRLEEEATDTETAQHIVPSFSIASADWELSHHGEHGPGEPATTESSLRTTALLQSVRRHARFSTRSRNQLESYILEREGTGHATEERERQSSTRQRRHAAPSSSDQQEPTIDLGANAQMVAMQRARLNIAIENHPKVSRWLEEAIKYLERLRFCDTYSERISSAAEGGFLRGEYLTHNQDDFILDTTTISPPPESSWLKAGGVFSGSQHSAGNALPSYQVTDRPSRRRSAGALWTSDVSSPSILGSTANAEIARSSHNDLIRASAATDDTWPVKVTINSIDYSTMTLSGTMEAFNVPRKLTLPQESSIITFLEGEIIDFNRYTLETKSFTADASIDSTYWRKLEPFKSLTDKEIVSNLVSIKWLREELGKKWILMRWKEKCFVTPSDEDSGLTISGFYYVSLRRSDGHIEGLYYDPKSTPYQYLSLMPEKRLFPAYEFR